VISIGLIFDIWTRARSDLQRELIFLRSAFHDPLADYVWSLDLPGLQGIVDGMVRLPLIEGVLIADAQSGRVFAAAGEVGSGEGLIGYTFSLHHRYADFDSEDDIVAWATIYRPANALVARAWPSIALILVAAMVKTFLLFVLFYVFSRRILQRPLVRLAEGVDHLSRNLDDARPLAVTRGSGEELDQVEAAVNRLVSALNQKKAESDRYAAALEGARDELEERVHLRTSELEGALIEAEDANRAKSRFLAMTSHELRTPLNAVLGFSELIRDAHFGPLEQRYRDYAADVNAAGQHLLEIINDMLDLTRLEAGRLEVHPRRIEVFHLVKSLRQLVGERPRQHRVTLDFEVGGIETLWADETALRQMLLNLIGNAFKFTDPGGAILVAFERVPGGIAVRVSDTGIGMDAMQVVEARRMFSQVADGRRTDGLGLGLPIVEGLVELHGGTMEIDSAPRHGTTVTLFFPDGPAGQAGGADGDTPR
jgi:signal transduction histidine kinase